VSIPDRGTNWVNLGDLPAWQGTLNEIGIIFYDDGEKRVEFHGLEITTHSLQNSLRKLYSDWSQAARWTQKSVNWLPAGNMDSDVPLPVIMGIWVLATLVIATIITRRTPGTYSSALLCAIAAWCILDLRWTANSMAQAATTQRDYPLVNATSVHFGDDNTTRELVDTARPYIDKPGQRTIIMAEDEKMRFQMLRAKYHALPAAVYVHESSVETVPIQMADHLLVLKKPYTAPDYKPATAVKYASAIQQNTAIRATPLWDKKEGFMLKIKRDAKAPEHDN
jgi:hypothetical protein